MYVRVYTPLLHDHLARVWRALIGTPFRIKVMDRRARVQRQALYPWDPLVCAVADIVTRERHLLIFEGTRSGSGYISPYPRRVSFEENLERRARSWATRT